MHLNHLACKIYSMKKGIALLITIGFITILTALIAYMFSLSEKVFDEVEKSEVKNQSAIIYFDVKSILNTSARDINDSNDLSNFLTGTPPFYDKNSGLSLDVELAPLNNKVNINSILINNKIDKNMVEFLQNICETYNILDSSFFIDLVLDTIDKDDVSRQAMSEISREDIKFSNGKIVNFSHFKTLLRYYVSKVNDKNILYVPWDRLIFFGDTQKDIVDCDRMSKELVNVLGFNSGDFTGCGDLKDPDYAKIAAKYGLQSFKKVNNYYILVKIYYQVNSISNRVAFVYNIKTKEASKSELF